MSGSNLDWGGGGGDYSFLISSIEGTISSSLPSDTSPIRNGNHDSFSSLNTPTNLKRSRLSIDSADFSNISHRSFNAGYGESLTSLAECDELKIVNEQLVEQLASCKTEHKISKDKLLRQLNYLEEQNTRYKADSESRLEKFFEEKKKWQLKIRELEHQNKQSGSIPTSTVSTTSKSATHATLESNTIISTKLKQLEKDVMSKSRELRDKTLETIELQNTVETLQQELRLNQAIHPASSSSQESEEMKELQRSVQDLEMKLKRRARESEKLEARLKNQSKLEEELINASSQLKLAHDRIKRFEAIESSHQRLVDEKAAWRSLFQGIMQSSSTNNQQDSSKEVTPTNVLRLLSAAQEKCSLLMRTQSDLELSNTALQTQLRQTDASLKELQQSNKEAVAISAALTKRNSIMSQQFGLFDGEVQSLRSLLRTYDVEFGLGKPTTDKVVALKDEQIASLTRELDKARATGVSLGNRVHELELASTQNISPSGDDQTASTNTEQIQQHQQNAEIVSLLKMEVEMLKMELSALQEVTGLDFVPERTRVLHLAHNPFSMARKTPLGSPVSTLPMDEIKRLRQTVRKASTLEGEGGDKAAAPESSEANNQSMNMSMMKPTSSSSTAATAASIADAAKMNLRLKEMFKERITAFREAVYLLTGYKIDLYSAEPSTAGGSGSLPRLRLRSMYSEKADDCLLFQVSC
jgi:mitotic spindle assembly checkpoint protein MAD1